MKVVPKKAGVGLLGDDKRKFISLGKITAYTLNNSCP